MCKKKVQYIKKITYIIIIISVLSKCRTFNANSATWLKFCPMAGLPLQTQDPR